MSAAAGRIAAVVCLLACAAAAALLFDPQHYLVQVTPPLPHEWLKRLHFLSHLYPGYPQLSLVLWGLILAAALLAWSSSRFALAVDGFDAGATALATPSVPLLLWIATLANVGLWVALTLGTYHWLMFDAWVIGLLLCGWLWKGIHSRRGGALVYPFDLREVTFLVVLAAIFILYCGYDLEHWRYSFMGDELGFWGYARYAVQNKLPDGRPGIVNAFTQEGVALYHPMMCTLYQNWFMRVLGINVFAWRLSSVFAAALALPGFYLFLREAISKPAAVAGTVILAANHYFITYAHHGLNNVQVLAPTLAALGLWVWGAKRDDVLALYASGVAAGLGFYTFYSSRLAVAFVMLGFLLLPRALPLRRRLPMFAAFLFGFAITMVPLIAASPHFLGDMLHQSVMRTESSETLANESAGALGRLWENLRSDATRTKWEACWIDPFWSLREGRFMYGSWVDSWVGSLFLVGLVWSALRWRRRPFLLWLLACYFVSVIGIGVLTQHAFPTDTRMLFLVPFYITFAVLALDVMRAELQGGTAALTRFGAGLLVTATVISVAANQYRYVIESPAKYSLAELGLVTKLVQTNPPDRHVYFVSPPVYDFNILYDLGTMYLYGDRVEIMRTDTIAAGRERIQRPAIMVFAKMFPESTDETLATLKQRYPVDRFETHTDGAGHNVVRALFLNPD